MEEKHGKNNLKDSGRGRAVAEVALGAALVCVCSLIRQSLPCVYVIMKARKPSIRKEHYHFAGSAWRGHEIHTHIRDAVRGPIPGRLR